MGIVGIVRIVMCLALVACATRRGNTGATDGVVAECTEEGAHRCAGATYQICTGGMFVTETECLGACLDGLGCVECQPGAQFCQDGNVWLCDDTGHPGMEIQVCGGQTTCISGGCADACADAANSKSYIRCEYWAVDLDNAIEVWGVVSTG